MDKRLAKIKLLALDVDGVLTDGTINIGTEGELFKAFNAKDGLGISAAIRMGLNIAIITGRKSAIIHKRAEELGITLLCEGVRNKYSELKRLQKELNLVDEEIAYIGDDLNDLPAFKAAGFTFAPADASEEVKEEACVILLKAGGKGAVRAAIELILKAQEKWQMVIDGYVSAATLGDRQ